MFRRVRAERFRCRCACWRILPKSPSKADFWEKETQRNERTGTFSIKSRRKRYEACGDVVETTGVEPVTSCMSSRHSNQLSYASIKFYKQNYSIEKGMCQSVLSFFRILCSIAVQSFMIFFVFSARIAFKIAITETPTSAKTASHIFAMPSAPRSKTRSFTPNAKTMFCRTMRSVF